MPLLEDWVRMAAEARLKKTLAPRLLEIIRRQASGCDEGVRKALDQDARVLEGLGHEVVRTPWLQGDGLAVDGNQLRERRRRG